MHRIVRVCIVRALLGLLTAASQPSALAVSLSFDSLPSKQGWRFLSGSFGPGVRPSEETVLSLENDSLTFDTVGLSGFADVGAIDALDTARPFSWQARLRVETLVGDGTSQAFYVGASSSDFGFFLLFQSDGELWVGNTGLGAVVDVYEEHAYRLDGNPDGSFAFFIDGLAVASGSGVPFAADFSALSFGDIGGGHVDVNGEIIENGSRVRIYELSVMQPIPEPGAMVMALLGLAVLTPRLAGAVRRR